MSKYFLRSKGTDASVKLLMATLPRKMDAHHVVALLLMSPWTRNYLECSEEWSEMTRVSLLSTMEEHHTLVYFSAEKGSAVKEGTLPRGSAALCGEGHKAV